MMKKALPVAGDTRGLPTADTVSLEIIRKSVHLLVALVPLLASLSVPFTLVLLGSGTLFYVFAESARRAGIQVAFVSDLTLIASRSRERDRFVLGPVTLGIGAMLALMLYPMQASAIALFSLAFGDSLASLVGRTVGGWRIPLTRNKTIAGSAACFVGILVLAYRSSDNLTAAFWIALTGAALEAFAADDMDNILIPVGTGFVAWRLLA
jgi:phytol kinase